MFKKIEGKEYPHETESRAIIRFQDCDPLQHLNNSKYFDYYFNAREDQVAKLYDFKFSEVFKNYKTSWVVYQQQIAYIRPALLSEWVRIFSSVIYFDSDTSITEYYMTDDENVELKGLLWVTTKYINVETGKRTPHQPQIIDYLSTILNPNFDIKTVGFNDRIKEIKHHLLEKQASL